MQRQLSEKGMLWISWPKSLSKAVVGLNEDIVRGIGLKHNLVDVKVIAVDGVLVGLKFVHRRSQERVTESVESIPVWLTRTLGFWR